MRVRVRGMLRCVRVCAFVSWLGVGGFFMGVVVRARVHRMDERAALAKDNELPVEMIDAVTETYVASTASILRTRLRLHVDRRLA